MSDHPTWPISTYTLLEPPESSAATIHIEHPNNLGTSQNHASHTEQARNARFRASYITEQMHHAAMHQTRNLWSIIFRRAANDTLLQRSREKTCFRKDNLNEVIPVNTDERYAEIADAYDRFLSRSQSAVRAAEELYGPSIAADIALGFSRSFCIHDQTLSHLPSVADAVNETAVQSDRPTTASSHPSLSLVVSYKHTTEKRGNMLNIHQPQWSSTLIVITKLCREAGCSYFRLWTDQILSYRKPSETLRWVSSGILPYTIYPVLYIMRPSPSSESTDIENTASTRKLRVQEDLKRMWISVEHLSACLGQGIIHIGDAMEEDELPKEWPTTYITVGMEEPIITWMRGLDLPIHGVLRKLCGAIMCGLCRVKEVSWVNDAQDIIDWASAISSSFTFRDLGHTFDCDHCQKPFGYTAQHRFMAVLSSAVVVSPNTDNVIVNHASPRLDVPAMCFEINGRTWDGFREWVPESCLWGLDHDQARNIRAEFKKKTQAVLVSDGSDKALAVLQFKTGYEGREGFTVAHLLVGLTTPPKKRYHGRVDWSKRFWPVNPIGMYMCFERVLLRNDDREALEVMADIVGASSGIDYRNIALASEVRTIQMRRVRWGAR